VSVERRSWERAWGEPRVLLAGHGKMSRLGGVFSGYSLYTHSLSFIHFSSFGFYYIIQ
jgi:hypothetical protein